MKKLLFIIALSALIFLAISLDKQEKSRDYFHGNIEVKRVDASFRIGGFIRELLADEGLTIKKGQLLARLDTGELELEINLKKADLAQAQAKLWELEEGPLPSEIEAAESLVKALEIRLKQAENDLSRIESLYLRKISPENEYENAQTGVNILVAQKNEAKARLKLLQDGIRPQIINQAKALVIKAEEGIKLGQLMLSYAGLYAPVSGIVENRFFEIGELAQPGMTAFSILDFSDSWAWIYIPEDKLGTINMGDKAKIYSDSWPGHAFAGEISFISSVSEFTPKNIQTKEERVKLVYRAKIRIGNHEQKLKPGMPVDAYLIDNSKKIADDKSGNL